MVILVYYVTLYVLPLVHKTPQNTKKGQNRQKMDVSCLVTMVTEFIFNYFSFDPDRAWSDGHFGVLHNLLYALIEPWDPKNPQK